ncbi:MAG: Histidine transport system permease protein HisQ [Candidatus Erwinia impunctatus]|nr:Histidine transport system permease protein HisQ [Culicoides impunctatus]
MLYGYSDLIMQGALVTLELAIASLVFSVVLGLVGASAKISGGAVLRKLVTAYTTLIRGVPDLVLMLLIFYGLQMVLNRLTDMMEFEQINIDPMLAGILTLGFIYGAYFTETFRGAWLAVPPGQIEAAKAFGFSPL